MESETIELSGIFSKGYGVISKLVMQDNEISLASKGLYSYLCSFSGKGNDVFPSQKKICYDLNISKDSLNKYMNELIKKRYISVYKQKGECGKFANNIYKINVDLNSPYPKISDTENFRCGKKPTRKISDTNNNNISNNNKKNNNNKVVGKPTPPANSEEVFEFIKPSYPNYTDSSLKVSCDNFIDYYKDKWRNVNWKDKCILWFQGDEKDNKFEKISKRRNLNEMFNQMEQ